MKFAAWIVAAVVMIWATAQPAGRSEPWTVIISGDTFGYLSPCGCVKPMSGGIRRRVAAIHSLKGTSNNLILDTGGLVKDTSRQSEMKAETLAQAMSYATVDAVHLSEADQQLGPAMTDAVERLSKAKLITTTQVFHKGPFTVLGADTEAEARELMSGISRDKTIPVLLYAGSREEARKLAEEFPSLQLIVYRTASNPPSEEEVIGKTWLVSPGEKGKNVLRLTWNGVKFEQYEVKHLGPDVHDDPKASQAFQTYLNRVKDEQLFEQLPRKEGKDFAGNQLCISCHQEEGEIWHKSRHGKALATLEKENQDRDPDCVSCHVVGSDFTTGYMSRKVTPNLTDVGCESCHGPGKAHAMAPKKYEMGKVGAASCMPCHNPNHSPGFDFEKYWPKIAH